MPHPCDSIAPLGEAVELPISPGRPLIVTLRVHGRLGVRELPAMLDTGASVMTISPTDASELGYDVGGAPASKSRSARRAIGSRLVK